MPSWKLEQWVLMVCVGNVLLEFFCILMVCVYLKQVVCLFAQCNYCMLMVCVAKIFLYIFKTSCIFAQCNLSWTVNIQPCIKYIKYVYSLQINLLIQIIFLKRPKKLKLKRNKKSDIRLWSDSASKIQSWSQSGTFKRQNGSQRPESIFESIEVLLFRLQSSQCSTLLYMQSVGVNTFYG